jgi:hypothetical protein
LAACKPLPETKIQLDGHYFTLVAEHAGGEGENRSRQRQPITHPDAAPNR